jgi:hypothetical protein
MISNGTNANRIDRSHSIDYGRNVGARLGTFFSGSIKRNNVFGRNYFKEIEAEEEKILQKQFNLNQRKWFRNT